MHAVDPRSLLKLSERHHGFVTSPRALHASSCFLPLHSLRQVLKLSKDRMGLDAIDPADLIKRLGTNDRQRFEWWLHAPAGDVRFRYHHGSGFSGYDPRILHSFTK